MEGPTHSSPFPWRDAGIIKSLTHSCEYRGGRQLWLAGKGGDYRSRTRKLIKEGLQGKRMGGGDENEVPADVTGLTVTN